MKLPREVQQFGMEPTSRTPSIPLFAGSYKIHKIYLIDNTHRVFLCGYTNWHFIKSLKLNDCNATVDFIG